MSSEPANGAGTEGLRVPSSDSPRPTSSSLRRNYSGKKEAMNGPLYRQTVNHTVLVRRLKRKGDGPSKQLARWFVENQIGMPLSYGSSSYTPLYPSPTAAGQNTASPKLCAPHRPPSRHYTACPEPLLVTVRQLPATNKHLATTTHLLITSSSQASRSTSSRSCFAPTIYSPNHSRTQPNLFAFNITMQSRESTALASMTPTLSRSSLSFSPACEPRQWSMRWLPSPSTWASARRKRLPVSPSKPGWSYTAPPSGLLDLYVHLSPRAIPDYQCISRLQRYGIAY